MLLLAPDKETDARPAKAVLRRGPGRVGRSAGRAYRYLPRTQTKPESRTVRSVSRRGHGRARGRPNRHRSTVARSLAVGQITTHPPWPLQPCPPACLRPAPQGPGERMRVRSTGAVAALGVAPRGAPRCCRPHQSVRSTLEPSPCRRAPLPTRTRSSAVACSGSSGCGGESQFEVSEWLVARVGICCTAAAGQR